MIKFKSIGMLLSLYLLFFACQDSSENQTNTTTPTIYNNTPTEIRFNTQTITDSAKLWWARALGDANGDKRTDLFFIHNNGSGGYLAYYQAPSKNGEIWQLVKIAEAPPTGGTFASGDLDAADIDGDGDMDVLGVKHTGEWDNAGEPAEIFWYENQHPNWVAHPIGGAPDAVKDVNLADFNGDGKMDLSVLTFDESKLTIFRQDGADQWTRVYDKSTTGLHEGMDAGDLDGDGDLDISANGYWFQNPGGDLTGDWTGRVIHKKWFNQTGDWSANATKNAIVDLNEDGKMDVVISHSERGGYPLAWYSSDDPVNGKWTEHIIKDSIAACHTLQVFDMDLDGDLDVFAGINQGRAVNINVNQFDVTIFLNDGQAKSWIPKVISDKGIYNGQIADLEGDGDYDIFQLPSHESTTMYLLENKLK